MSSVRTLRQKKADLETSLQRWEYIDRSLDEQLPLPHDAMPAITGIHQMLGTMNRIPYTEDREILKEEPLPMIHYYAEFCFSYS